MSWTRRPFDVKGTLEEQFSALQSMIQLFATISGIRTLNLNIAPRWLCSGVPSSTTLPSISVLHIWNSRTVQNNLIKNSGNHALCPYMYCSSFNWACIAFKTFPFDLDPSFDPAQYFKTPCKFLTTCFNASNSSLPYLSDYNLCGQPSRAPFSSRHMFTVPAKHSYVSTNQTTYAQAE